MIVTAASPQTDLPLTELAMNVLLCRCKQACLKYCKLSLASGSAALSALYTWPEEIFTHFSLNPLQTICQRVCV